MATKQCWKLSKWQIQVQHKVSSHITFRLVVPRGELYICVLQLTTNLQNPVLQFVVNPREGDPVDSDYICVHQELPYSY